jgi:Fe-S cluster assembly ATP-binding protein
MSLLEIRSLHVEVEGKPILKGLDLTIGAGEVHAIMGPNGSGKSTLANVLAGRPGYEIVSGSIRFSARTRGSFSPFSIRPKFLASATWSF